MKFFRRSPLKNENLQKYVKEEIGHELQLILDVKTRWNSLENMLVRFLKLRIPICKALIDQKVKSLISDEDFQFVGDIVQSLTPIRLCAEALGRKDATLMTAEAAFGFVMDSLQELKSPVSRLCLDAVKKRYEERRLENIVSLMTFLHNPENYNRNEGHFHLVSKNQLVKTAKSILMRLFRFSEKVKSPLEDIDKSQETLESRLERAINNNCNKLPTPADDEFKSILKEINLYEATKRLTPTLTHLFNTFKIIRPTSIEAERVFSTVTSIVTKNRSRLNDDTIDAITYIKLFYRNK